MTSTIMSTKAQKLLGVEAQSERRGGNASRNLSRQTSFYTDNGENDSGRPSLPSEDHDARSIRSEASSYHPKFSVVTSPGSLGSKSQKSSGLRASPQVERRPSSSTLRSFAPPTIPTCLPRHATGVFAPHVAYGRHSASDLRQQAMPSLLSPLDASVRPAAEPRNGLRKALSKISLRSTRSRSHLSEVTRAPSPPHEPMPSESMTPLSPPERSSLRTQDDRLRAKVTRQESDRYSAVASQRDYLHPGSRTLQQGESSSRREWFDRIETGPDGSAKEQQYLSHAIEDTTGITETRARRSSMEQRSFTTGVLKSPSSSSQLRSPSSVVFEQTMFSFDDSDGDNELAQNTPLSPRKKRGTAKAKSSRSSIGTGASVQPHQRPLPKSHAPSVSSRPSTFYETAPPVHAAAISRPESFVPLDDKLTESLPSLMGSGSSRPNSYFSSQPGSPMMPLLVYDQTMMDHLQSGGPLPQSERPQLTQKELRRSGASIVSDLKQGSPGNRIIAAISPEEAILITKIRRNKTADTVSLRSTASIDITPKARPEHLSRASSQPALMTSQRSRTSTVPLPSSTSSPRMSIVPLPSSTPSTRNSMRFSSVTPTSGGRISMRPAPLSSTKVPPLGRSGSGRARPKSHLMWQTQSQPEAAPPPTPQVSDFPTPPAGAAFSKKAQAEANVIGETVSRATRLDTSSSPIESREDTRAASPLVEDDGSHEDVLAAWRELGGLSA